MTREEAIQFLDNMRGNENGRAIGAEGFYAELCGYHVQALNMAIKALEQEPVLDKIRTEISSLIAEYDARCERWKPSRYKPTKGIAQSDVAPRSPKEIESTKWGERAEGLERALKIIDKHVSGKESEEQA